MADHETRADIDLVSGAFWGRNPHDAFTWMRANAPVYWDGHVWGITRYADLRAIAKDPATFSNAGGIRPGSGPIPMMIDMDDPEHLRRRKLVNKGYTPRRIRDREDELRGVCDQIIDEVAEKGECDFVWDIAAPLPLIMIGNDLGVAPEDRDQLLTWSDAMLSALTGDDAAMGPAADAFVGYTAYATDVIADRTAEPGDDLMSVLCQAEVDGDRLDHDSIVHESLLILIGGDETTRHVISGGAWQLLSDRSLWDALRVDPALLSTGIEEMLRWVSPIKNMDRTATRDVVVGGQQIHEGDDVLLLYPSANRDEDVFDDSQHFDVRRSPNPHLSFGIAEHFCLGVHLARLEGRVFFEELLAAFDQIELAGDPVRLRSNLNNSYKALPVRLAGYRPPIDPGPRTR